MYMGMYVYTCMCEHASISLCVLCKACVCVSILCVFWCEFIHAGVCVCACLGLQ